MKNVRCKFTCREVKKTESAETVSLSPVSSGTPEDNTYSKYTPCGSLELSITNEAVFGFFKPGKAYYLDVEQVPDPEPVEQAPAAAE